MAVEKVLENEKSLLTSALSASSSAEGMEPVPTAGVNLKALREQVQ